MDDVLSFGALLDEGDDDAARGPRGDGCGGAAPAAAYVPLEVLPWVWRTRPWPLTACVCVYTCV
jgi:hypothetical protein